MQKILFGGGYVICNIKVTIFLRCTMIADKKKIQRIKALEALDDNILRHSILYSFEIFVFPFSYFLPLGTYGFY